MVEAMVHGPSIRDEMREATFARDGGKCVFCAAPAVDAHHIIERRLWPDGGYVLDNLASVCADCHLYCEQTLFSPDEVREAAGITRVVLPPHFYPDVNYDKWGNIILDDGNRLPGELYDDHSVQKVMNQGGVLGSFLIYVKYPRTYHLPWSPGVTSDDRVMEDLSGLEGREVVVTEKRDGENTSLYRNGYVHARSIDAASHPSQSWIRSTWAKVAHELPEGWRVCGENLYAVHSIRYEELDSYFAVFSVWNEWNECLSWDDTCDWAELLGFPTVPEMYRGGWDEQAIRGLWSEADRDRVEGYVVRTSEGFPLREFRHRVGKLVRSNHVTTDRHWKAGRALERNGLM
jgi:hypothetical protein